MTSFPLSTPGSRGNSPSHDAAGSAALMAELAALASGDVQTESFLTAALRRLREAAQAEAVALASASEGAWTTLARDGTTTKPPAELLAETLDQQRPMSEGRWLVVPVIGHPGKQHQQVLALLGSKLDPAIVVAAAAVIGAGQAQIHKVDAQQQRLRRLETILAITRQWNATLEMVPLLTAMAEAATSLIGADRASIFLWDKRNHILVARPALGVESGELRVPDSAGVVGEVIYSGDPRRVSRAKAGGAIDRQVDKQLGYRTENVLCVPLTSASGDVIGAFEVLNKRGGDFTEDDQQALVELAAHAATALANTQQFEQLVSRHKVLVDQAATAGRMIGACPAIEKLRTDIARVANTDISVLILGENGTGKEVVAQSIHYQSRRRDEPLVAVNCAAIPETLLESELFGHEKGAFTDAREMRIGKFELAARGTLFLDEIGDLSPGGQAKLLRVLEEKVVVRVGGSQPIHTDARVIAATNQGLAELVRQKKFREDLFFRLNVVALQLPPLRDRGDDIVHLAEHFLGTFCRTAGRRMPTLLSEAKKRLRAYACPGNIRELRNLMERLAYLSTAEKIDAEELEPILAPGSRRAAEVPDNLELADATQCFQQEYIHRAIQRSGQNMSEAAERLGLHRSNLYRKMRQLGMDVEEER
ncbi:MAG: sigma-54-dependent Fis family transcriptional regulator [Planctomycetes bacterium]|nr:sigma-54-dependent Fis family transcriptional regulator [Planctomycetota bacterium]